MPFLNNPYNIAWFISSHGFGHAARSAAIMTAWRKVNPNLHFHLYTQTPQWFFDEALGNGFTYHLLQSDVGLVQSTPMTQDLVLTRQKLSHFFKQIQTEKIRIAQELRDLQIRFVSADISPLGILSAAQASIPSVLIENFTWDWIYEIYRSESPEWDGIIQQMQQINALPAAHIQTDPVCNPFHQATLLAPPASREPRNDRAKIRTELGIPPTSKMVLVTMGGIPEVFNNLESIKPHPEVFFVIPGGSHTYQKSGQILLIPHHSRFYHPDLIHASDAVIGKAGYSTIAEVYQSGVPFGYIIRSNFRESPVLADYLNQKQMGFQIDESTFLMGNWEDTVQQLLESPRRTTPAINGANVIANFLEAACPSTT